MKTDFFAAKGTGNLFPPLSGQLLGILRQFFCFLHLPRYALLFLQLEAGAPIPMCFTAALPQLRRGPRLWSRVSTRRWGGSRNWTPSPLSLCAGHIYTECLERCVYMCTHTYIHL